MKILIMWPSVSTFINHKSKTGNVTRRVETESTTKRFQIFYLTYRLKIHSLEVIIFLKPESI